MALLPAHLGQYQAHGYAVLRRQFDATELALLGRAFDRIYAEAMRLGRSFRHQNLFYRLSPDANLGTIVRLVQWAARVDPALDTVRLDRRLFDIVSPLLGPDLKQIINQMHWKPPGAAMTDFSFHQDCRFRRPASAFRNLATSYVQTGIAIDRHNPASGAMRIIPGSHRRGDLDFAEEGPIASVTMNDESLRRAGLDPKDLVDLNLEPGDVALWSPYLVHGSGPNSTARDRRFYINGFVAAADSDRGEWAWRGGEPVPLGEVPALVTFDDVHRRPEPHYVTGF